MTHTDPHTQSPGTPPGGQPRHRHVSHRTISVGGVSHRAILGTAIATATVAGAAVLGVATFASDDQNQAPGRPAIAGQDDDRATRSSAVGREPAASVTVSGRPWEDERFVTCVETESRRRAAHSSSDDGLPNPWEAGNIASTCHLLITTAGAPSTSTSARDIEAP